MNNASFDFLIKSGMFGRKPYVEKILSHGNMGLDVKRMQTNQLYEKIKRMYHEIRLHELWSTRIGEYIPRYLTAVKDAEKNSKRGILDVFVLTDCVNHNSRLSQIIGRNIQVIDQENADIWVYILCHFPRVEFTKYWNDYSDRNKDRILKPDHTMRYFKLTDEEKKEGEYKKKLMGLQGAFVCIQSRDSVYLSTIYPKTDWEYHNYRDADINQLNLSASYLMEKGIVTVRMGRYVKETVQFNNCIDYANKYYDELMDIVLTKECKFYVGDSCGLCVLPMAQNVPVALKNVVPAFFDPWGAVPQNLQNLFIFKKYFSKHKNRFLSIKEMMKIEKKIAANKRGPLYAKLGIELVENSAEEILDLVKEMNARIDGKWVETEEDIQLQKKYQAILGEWCKQKDIKTNAVFHGKIGAVFLRNNQFLLE